MRFMLKIITKSVSKVRKITLSQQKSHFFSNPMPFWNSFKPKSHLIWLKWSLFCISSKCKGQTNEHRVWWMHSCLISVALFISSHLQASFGYQTLDLLPHKRCIISPKCVLELDDNCILWMCCCASVFLYITIGSFLFLFCMCVGLQWSLTSRARRRHQIPEG